MRGREKEREREIFCVCVCVCGRESKRICVRESEVREKGDVSVIQSRKKLKAAACTLGHSACGAHPKEQQGASWSGGPL